MKTFLDLVLSLILSDMGNRQVWSKNVPFTSQNDHWQVCDTDIIQKIIMHNVIQPNL